MKPFPGKVIWHDAHAGTGWWDYDDAIVYKPLEIITYGWVIRRDKVATVIALSYHPGKHKMGRFGDTLDIPAGMVRSVRRIKV